MDDVLDKKPLAIPQFGAAEVEAILRIEHWRLHRFLSRYKLTTSGQLGEGRGSRRVFSTEDIYRIATAAFLIRDGFAHKLVAQIVSLLEDEHFHGSHDDKGVFSTFGLLLRRTGKGPEASTFRLSHPPTLTLDGPVYYALDLGVITQEVNDRIAKLKKTGKEH